MLRFFFLLFFLSHSTYLVSKNIDSLIAQLDVIDENQKVNVFSELSWELKFSDPKKALEFGLEGLALARSLPNEKKESELLKNIGVLYHLNNEFDEARKYCNEAIKLFQKQNNAEGIASVNNILGLVYSNQGIYEEALNYFEKSVAIYEALADTVRIISVEANIGNLHLRKGEYQKALPFYNRIVDDARQRQDKQKLGLNIFNLGILYNKLGDYPKALTYLFEASEIHKSENHHYYWIKTQNEIGLIYRRLDLVDDAISIYIPILEKAEALSHKNLVASISNNLGLCYSRKEELEKALACYNRTLEIRDSLEIKNVGHVLNNIGSVYYAQGKKEKALELYRQALDVNTQLGAKSKMAADISDLGELFLDEKNYPQAERYLLNAYSIFEETKELQSLVNVTTLLSALYQSIDQKEKEAQFLKLHQAYSDSLYSKEKILASNRILIRELIKEKTAELNASNTELKDVKKDYGQARRNNQLLIGGFAILSCVIIFGVLYYRKKAVVKKQDLSQKLDKVQLEKEELQETLEKKNKELVVFSLEMVQNKNLLKSLKTHLGQLAKKQPENAEIRNMVNRLNMNDVITKDWSYFNEVFNITFPNFTKNIREAIPNLSRKELQHCVLIKLNISPSEAANILGITTESVHTARYRLRKKINLNRHESLEDAILNF